MDSGPGAFTRVPRCTSVVTHAHDHELTWATVANRHYHLMCIDCSGRIPPDDVFLHCEKCAQMYLEGFAYDVDGLDVCRACALSLGASPPVLDDEAT